MARRSFTLDQFVDYLARAVTTAGSQRELARQLAVSEVDISYVLRRKRAPSRALLKALGYELVREIRPVV
jgi:DNA-binding transcriptional regulator YdaS (Cro superfamily)